MTNRTPDIVRSDGTLWIASYKDDASAMRALFDRSAPQFFFRAVSPNPRRFWWCPWRPRFVLTGETWEGHNMRDGGFRFLYPKNKEK